MLTALAMTAAGVAATTLLAFRFATDPDLRATLIPVRVERQDNR